MTATAQKIKLAQEKSIEWIEYLATKSEKDLEKRLRINHLQYEIAVKEGEDDVCELLNIMERIIIEARIYKAEHTIPDVISEIEKVIAEIETVEVKTEERKEAMEEFENPVNPPPNKVQTRENNDSQLSLF